jgi:putative ABC transport system substrate-binding protein
MPLYRVGVAIAVFAILTHGSIAQTMSSTVPRIAFVYSGSKQSAQETGRYDAFVTAMRKLGYIDGQTYSLETRFANDKTDALPALAAAVVKLKPDVIVATGTPLYRALRYATTTIPVVVTVTQDPVADGLASSLARPGGNFTGLSVTAAVLGPKHLEIMREAFPRLSRLAVLLNPTNVAHPTYFVRLVAEAQKANIQITLVEAGSPTEIEAGLRAVAQKVDALVILSDTFFVGQAKQLAMHTAKHRLPAIFHDAAFANAGGLFSFGPDLTNNFSNAAIYVDKILHGANPAELPFEQPSVYHLLINMKSAEALGLKLPNTLTVRASQLIR